MINIGKNELICDLAETYGIYDYRSLPLRTVATLAVGLRGTSRIKMKMRGVKMPADESFLLAIVIDRIRDVLIRLGAYEENSTPTSAVSLLMGNIFEEEEQGKYETFDSVEDFNEERKKLLR